MVYIKTYELSLYVIIIGMKTNGKTKIIGVFGNPISHTASPAMHNAAFEHLNLDYIYIPILVNPSEIGTAVNAIRAYNMAGVNVTIPFKETVIPYLDELDSFAENVGAVNTIVNNNGILKGYNTDGPGFILSLQEESNFSLNNKTVFIFGAGGAAKGLAHILIQNKIGKLVIFDLDNTKAESLANSVQKMATINVSNIQKPEAIKAALEESDLVINSTPVGMAPNIDRSPIQDFSWASNSKLCYDIIYKPAKTKFLQESEKHGAQIMGGAGMLAGQGILAFNLFTGKNVPYEIMRKEV